MVATWLPCTLPWKALAPVLAAVVIALLPAPPGLPHAAWLYFALFAGVIVGLILEPVPAAAVGFIGISIAVGLNLVEAKPAASIQWVFPASPTTRFG